MSRGVLPELYRKDGVVIPGSEKIVGRAGLGGRNIENLVASM